MDRNTEISEAGFFSTKVVATREGGVDRNRSGFISTPPPPQVATREGGVDRNRRKRSGQGPCQWSPPARVAWIETHYYWSMVKPSLVATREGGVDRNPDGTEMQWESVSSPPVRVAWIETALNTLSVRVMVVATREGGVDRNVDELTSACQPIDWSPPARVAWIETSEISKANPSILSRHPRGWRG